MIETAIRHVEAGGDLSMEQMAEAIGADDGGALRGVGNRPIAAGPQPEGGER